MTEFKLPKTEEAEQINNIKLKPIYELNREFEVENLKKHKKINIINKKKRKKRGIFSLISDILFYLAVFTVLIAILTSAPNYGGGTAKTFMGYSYFTVLTSSMQNEIPKGSFILVKQTDPQALDIGDNITFMKDANTSVTHKIADIYENYNNSGARGFQTKGVNNANPDRDIVYETNIVGKVIWVLPAAGAAIFYIRSNIYIIFIIFGLLILLSFLLRGLFAKSPKADRLFKLPDFSNIESKVIEIE